MKNLRILMGLLVIASCQKQNLDTSSPETKSSTKNLMLETCKIDSSNLEAFYHPPVFTELGRGKPRNPRPASGVYSCIYVDFDGEAVRSAYWNGGSTLQCAPSGMTEEQINVAMNQINNAYANFNVVVTRDENVYLNADRYNRTRIVVTATSNWRPGVGGIAYTGSFSWGDETPGFVFSDRLYYIGHYVGETVAHEAGHTLGLYHQATYDVNCGLVDSYAMGKIMGNSLYVPYGEWAIGTSTSCYTIQNDIQVLNNKLGSR